MRSFGSAGWARLPVALLIGLYATPASPAATQGATSEAIIRVDVSHPLRSISPTLWGIFFEDISHAADGGLYAELVRNRSFEDGPRRDHWFLVTSPGAKGSISIDSSRPLNSANRRGLRLRIIDPKKGRVGLGNSGYWGIAAKKEARYLLSLYARGGDGFRGPLVVTLEGAGGTVYARAQLAGIAKEWRRFTCRLTPDQSDPSARLVIAASSPGTVWLDLVSLFPEDTFLRRLNGLRADLAQMLADLKPSAVRFPGGCYVEGDSPPNAYRWKRTVGDVAAREEHWNLWGYRTTNGLGYHEYLQLCEDLGAEPVPVINCGMTHGGFVPLAQMGAWVQDALDAIEYANGPVTSRWGGLRAQHGHPAPFNLKYIEIGNENYGPEYDRRYPLFHEAIRARYPNIKIIASQPVAGYRADLLATHLYMGPDWFYTRAHVYDSRDRAEPALSLNEYACTHSCGRGNLRAALAEAAFMTGLERNSDVVQMAAYAPLFANANRPCWNPNLIWFDSARAYGTPSYYAQQLFSRNRGDVALPVSMALRYDAQPPRGRIGVGTWKTQAEFADVRVTHDGRTLSAADFAAWRGVHGTWTTEEGVYRQTSFDESCFAVAGDPTWSDYTLTLRARKLAGAEGFLVMFRVRDDADWSWWVVGGWGNTQHAVQKCVGNDKELVGSPVPGSVETGRWYRLRVEVEGWRTRCYLDDRLVLDVTDTGFAPVAAGAVGEAATGEVILKIVNGANDPLQAAVTLEGVSSVAPRGTAVVLTSSSPEEENSFEHPTRVSPVTQVAEGLGRSFNWLFPANSLTVLRVKAE